MKIIADDNIDYLLSEKQLALWQWATNNGVIFSRKDAIAALGFPARTIEEIIKKLVKLNRLERIGEGKATRYKICQA